MREAPALLALALLAGALLTGCATAPSGTGAASAAPAAVTQLASDVTELQDLFVQTLPIGQVLARVAAEEPNWPLQNHMDQYSAKDVACLRSNLQPEKGDAVLRKRAAAYAAKHPDRVKDDVAVLKGGVTAAMAKTAGAAMTGKAAAEPRGEDLKPLVEFLMAPRHQDLREAMYMDAIADAMLGGQSGRNAGRGIGARIMVPLVLDAAQQCNLKFGS